MGLLVVDDVESARRVVKRILEDEHEVQLAGSLDEARRLLAQGPVELVLCDIRMGDASGLDLAREICAGLSDTAVVMVTGVDDPTVAEEALEIGVYGYLVKPFTPNELRITVASALRRLAVERIGGHVYNSLIDRLSRVELSLEGLLDVRLTPEIESRVRAAIDEIDEIITSARSVIMGVVPPDRS